MMKMVTFGAPMPRQEIRQGAPAPGAGMAATPTVPIAPPSVAGMEGLATGPATDMLGSGPATPGGPAQQVQFGGFLDRLKKRLRRHSAEADVKSEEKDVEHAPAILKQQLRGAQDAQKQFLDKGYDLLGKYDVQVMLLEEMERKAKELADETEAAVQMAKENGGMEDENNGYRQVALEKAEDLRRKKDELERQRDIVAKMGDSKMEMEEAVLENRISLEDAEWQIEMLERDSELAKFYKEQAAVRTAIRAMRGEVSGTTNEVSRLIRKTQEANAADRRRWEGSLETGKVTRETAEAKRKLREQKTWDIVEDIIEGMNAEEEAGEKAKAAGAGGDSGSSGTGSSQDGNNGEEDFY